MNPELLVFLTGLLVGVLGMIAVNLGINISRIWKSYKSQSVVLNKAYETYRQAYEQLTPEEKSDIQLKARNTMELVAEAYELPESHYESLGTTREAHVKQLYAEYNTWIKRNKYPNFNDYIPGA